MKRIYLDHTAATPLRPEVREAMEPWLHGVRGNPSGVHRSAREARRALEEARARTAAALGRAPEEIRFVRGGTEANNLALLGWAEAVGSPPGLARIHLSGVEHSSVRETAETMARRGVELAPLPIAPNGEAQLEEEPGAASSRPELVCLMAVSHETGTVHDLAGLAPAVRARGAQLHVDGVQAQDLLREVSTLADTLALSAHKLGGPRSLGVLVVRAGREPAPLLFGGGQEGGLRPGTEDVAGAVGAAVAVEWAVSPEGNREARRLGVLRDRLEGAITDRFPFVRVLGREGRRSPRILALGVPGVERDLLPRALDLEGVEASAGAACRSGSLEPSPGLSAYFGLELARSIAPLRLSLGWTTTAEEVEEAILRIGAVLERITALAAPAGMNGGSVR